MSKQIFNDVQWSSLTRQMRCESMPQHVPREPTKPGPLSDALQSRCMNYVLGRPKPYEAADDHALEQQQEKRSQEFLKTIPSAVLIEVLQKHRERKG